MDLHGFCNERPFLDGFRISSSHSNCKGKTTSFEFLVNLCIELRQVEYFARFVRLIRLI